MDLYQPIYANAGYLMKALDMLLVPLGTNGWNMPADEVKAALAKARQSWNFVKADVWLDAHSIAFAFSTRDGTEGVLQTSEKNHTLRYKLVQEISN